VAGLYFHIPFCRQACHYCNFHFSTSLKYKDELLQGLVAEVSLRHQELGDQTVETIYFGGGTPSLLTPAELATLLHSVHEYFMVSPGAEVTLEANPDDLNAEHASGINEAGINRLSLGIQSFHESDLKYMNRVHTASDAREALAVALRTFSNVSLDLIFGTPTLTNESWKENLRIAIESGAPHISAYALTVEDKTALKHFIEVGKTTAPDDQHTAGHFETAMEVLGDAGYDHYEISNYAKPGFMSRHNSSYWTGAAYLGFGPSAHSFDGRTRSWNVSNNAQYIRDVHSGQLQRGSEALTPTDRANEMIMTGLRTKNGFDPSDLKGLTSSEELNALLSELTVLRSHGLIEGETGRITLTQSGKLLADGIISRLFV
jgi:oxygen-independent coproporphyrinogen-3 oxidase